MAVDFFVLQVWNCAISEIRRGEVWRLGLSRLMSNEIKTFFFVTPTEEGSIVLNWLDSSPR